MSSKSKGKMTCPNCRTEFEFDKWDSINTRLNPEMKAKVRNEEAFKVVCPNCNQHMVVGYTCLYNQEEDNQYDLYCTRW